MDDYSGPKADGASTGGMSQEVLSQDAFVLELETGDVDNNDLSPQLIAVSLAPLLIFDVCLLICSFYSCH